MISANMVKVSFKVSLVSPVTLRKVLFTVFTIFTIISETPFWCCDAAIMKLYAMLLAASNLTSCSASQPSLTSASSLVASVSCFLGMEIIFLISPMTAFSLQIFWRTVYVENSEQHLDGQHVWQHK